jgi:hypothetical protein
MNRLRDRVDVLLEVHPLAVALEQGLGVDLMPGSLVFVDERPVGARRRR